MAGLEFKIIAGLGNPGKNYAATRHNVGFLAVQELAARFSLVFDKTLFDSEYIKARIMDTDVFLVRPLCFMNRSGFPIRRFASFYKVDIKDIIIIHDDADLEFGKLKVVQSKGHGGHNGIRSVIEAFGRKDCVRIRIGIGRSGKDMSAHVLGRFTQEEKKVLDPTLERAVEASLSILENGVEPAMNFFNKRESGSIV